MLLLIDCKPIRSTPPKPCLPILLVQLSFRPFTLIHLKVFTLFELPTVEPPATLCHLMLKQMSHPSSSVLGLQ